MICNPRHVEGDLLTSSAAGTSVLGCEVGLRAVLGRLIRDECFVQGFKIPSGFSEKRRENAALL